MNREEAAREIDNTACCFSDKRFRDAMHMAAAALRGPQPDPTTGLVPCGCKGKPEFHSSKYGYVASVKMHAECPDCHAKTAEYYAFLYSDGALEELQRRVMDAWNTMRGYKEVPE